MLTLKSFERDFRFGTGHGETSTSKAQSLAVSLQQLGAFVGCFAISPVTHRFGRRVAIMFSSLVFCIGAVIETIDTHSLPAFYVARVIAGLGLGGATVVVPIYSSEMSPPELRGQIGCFFQLFFTLGSFASYWIAYGVQRDVSSTVPKQWQIPIALQLVPGGLLGLGMLTLRESVRWHAARGDADAAWESLRWVRASSGPEVRAELDEIQAGVALELRETAGLTVRELMKPLHFKLLVTGFMMFFAQQATGATALAYFAPQYFKLLIGGSDTQSLLISGLYAAVKVIACGTFVFFLSERIPRRAALIVGAAFMAAFQLITAAVVKTRPPPGHGVVTSSGIATVAMIYLFVIVYNMSWGALPWPYVSEIFPTRIREAGVGVAVASQWLWAFVFTLVSPYMVNDIGYGTFLFWGLLNVLICVGAVLFIKETRGKSLEQINAEYRGADATDELARARAHGVSEEDDVARSSGSDIPGALHVDAKASDVKHVNAV